MYLEFRLPTGSGGMAAQHVNSLLSRELNDWAQEFEITYDKKIVKWTAQVTFRDPRHYTLFALTWNPKNQRFRDWIKYDLIDSD